MEFQLQPREFAEQKHGGISTQMGGVKKMEHVVVSMVTTVNTAKTRSAGALGGVERDVGLVMNGMKIIEEASST